jgi:glycogen operon protein
MRTDSAIEAGAPYPLGASSDGAGTNFAVFSDHAVAIDVCLFDRHGRRETARHRLPECTDGIWHGYVRGVVPGDLYGLRADGPYEPQAGHRFNPHKLLLDPYARQLAGTLRWTDALYGYRLNSPRADLSFDRRDSAAAMPKAVVVDDAYNWHGDVAPNVPWERTVIYETHVRGITRQLEGVELADRASFRGLANPWLVEHLVRLGVTTIELMPVHAFLQDRRLVEQGLRNYWGYNTLAFFAPEPTYLSSGQLAEVKDAVRALHRAGIEVVLDVVYNHTCEGNELGPTLSLRGLDNASYYRLSPDNPRHCIDDTGTGNTLDCSHPRVIQLIADSLRHWVEAYHVDGFRFDLGVTLGREHDGFHPDAGLFDVLRQDPVLGQAKLVFEPWDIGPGGYQLGAHPPGFAEWNGRFRDDVRRFWKGEAGQRGNLAHAIQGSAGLFDHQHRRPWASVNFVTAHDGFTLADLVSYEHKHNEANGEENRDGHDDNASTNWGVEGPTDDPAISGLRARVQRAFLATLAFSLGTPMLLGGDEFGRSQGGNNNAYCQDNPVSWYDWSLAATDAGREQIAYVQRLFALRRRHAGLRAGHFLHGEREVVPGLPELAWFDEQAKELDDEDWAYAEARLLVARRVVAGEDGQPECLLLLFNGSGDARDFSLPPPALAWQLLLDSADPAREPAALPQDAALAVEAHSVCLLLAQPRPAPARAAKNLP